MENLNILKQEIKKLLSQKGQRIWNAIEWDQEEVGNSVIGFLDLDPNTTPKKIAEFINERAEKEIKD